MSNHNEETKRLVNDLDQRIEDESVEMSGLLRTLGREALVRVRELSKQSEDLNVAVRAAIDLADRSPETAKIQKIQDVTPRIGRDEAKLLASVLVEAARVNQRFKDEVKDGLVRIEATSVVIPPEDRAEEAEAEGELSGQTPQDPPDEAHQVADEEGPVSGA